jgi:hypothetical protein
MPSSLILALALSLALHASLLLPEAFKREPPSPPPILQALLRLPVKPPQVSAEPLLKNTLASTAAPPAVKPPPPPKPAARRPQATKPSTRPDEVEAAQRKLSQHLCTTRRTPSPAASKAKSA